MKLIIKKGMCTNTNSTKKAEKIPPLILFFAAVEKVKEKHFTFTHHIISCMNFNKRRKDMTPEELAEVRAYGRQKSAEFRQRKKEKEAAEAAAAADAQAAAETINETEAEKVNQESLIDKEGLEKEAAAAEIAIETQKQNKQQKPTPEENHSGKSFKCSCGADIYPDYDGDYPDFCSKCGTENDYRGISYFENSRTYLVCENCGKVSKVRPHMKKCPKCGYGGA